jgi:Flp pilus assembly CpaF family ATPase
MQFWLYDHSTNTQQTLEVDKEPIVIGRYEDCDIVLTGPFVARKHARIARKGNQLIVENLGRSSLTVANRDVVNAHPMKIDFGDEMQIGQFSLAIIRPGTKTAGRGVHDQSQQFQQQLMEFESLVHAQLLDRMNLRITGAINKSDQTFITQILSHLDAILNEQIGSLDKKVIGHAVGAHLHRLVVAEVVRQCQGRVQTEYQAGETAATDVRREKAIAELVASAVDTMPLIFDALSVVEDLAIAEETFLDQFNKMYKAISTDQRQYIVRRMVAKDIQDIMLGWGPLQDLLDMANVSEVMVVGKDRIYVEKNGVIQPTTRSFFSDEILMSVIERILTPVGRRVDHSTPMVDARLPDGSRVNVIIPPLSLVGPCLTIRKFSWIPFTMDDLIERDSISSECAEFLRGCIIGLKNMLISGGTGSGKTTLLNTLSAFCRPTERIITIEESAELRLPQPHVLGLESRPPNIEGRGEFTIRELLRNALRMRPDRIIVGEVRGPEAIDMLQAMNTGHDGSMSTLHANEPPDAIKRLESLVLMGVDMPMRAIREQIVGAVDMVVQITRFASGHRRVTHISEITQIDRETGEVRIEDIFVLRNAEQKRLRHTGYIPSFAQNLIEKGFLDVSVFL